jgi:hypothetical protein
MRAVDSRLPVRLFGTYDISGKRFLLGSILAILALALGASRASAQNSTYWCSAHPTLDPCVVSASLDGATITPSDPNYDVWAIPSSAGGANTVQWSIQPVSAMDLSAALGHTFSITIDTTVTPRAIYGFGGSMVYTRTPMGGSEYQVTVTGQPVSVTDQDGCTFPAGGPTCSPVAPGPSSVVFEGAIDNYRYHTYLGYPLSVIDSFYGMDMYTNIAETGQPPTIIPPSTPNGPAELEIQMADHHFLSDGVTVVQGNFWMRIPAAFLAAFYGINDPSTLATDGLAASIGAGTVSVTVEPGGAAADVNITGVTFSPRKLMIRLGIVTPRRPTDIRTHRLSSTRARVSFRRSRPRGQRVTSYALSCRAIGGRQKLTIDGGRSPLVLHGLTARKAYRCTLRGHSRAGYGPRSRRFRIAA